MHVPVWHVPPVHGVPFGLAGYSQIPSIGLQAPALWHSSAMLQVIGVPVQEPPWHESMRVQRSLSVHVFPSVVTGLLQVPVVGSHVPTSWH
jgi:hypothetical protein